jgi:hypothetical protein
MKLFKAKCSLCLIFSYLFLLTVQGETLPTATQGNKTLCDKSVNIIFHGDEKTPLRHSSYIPQKDLKKLLEKLPDFSDKWSIDQYEELTTQSKEITSVNTFILNGKNCSTFNEAWEDLENNLKKVARTLSLSEFALRDAIVGIESASPQKVLYSFTRMEDNSTIKTGIVEMLTSKTLGQANEESVEVELASVIKNSESYEWEISGSIESQVLITRAYYILAPDVKDARLYK